MSDMTEEAAMKAAYEHLSASYRTDEDDFGCGWHAAMEWQAEAIKGAAVIADAAGAEIRALKARIAELEARDGEAVAQPYAYEIGSRDRTQELVYPSYLERYATAEERALPRIPLYAHPPTGDAAGKDDAAPMTADQLCDAIRETLLHYRLSNFQTDDGCGYPLVDRLTPPGSRDIGPGKEEIDLIADEIFNEVLTKHRPVAAGEDSVDAALTELQNIANAKRFDREYFDDDTSFADWAQSRARAAIASRTKTADGETS